MTKVMVIDDSAMMRLYLRRCLEKAGFEVEDWLPLSAMEIPERLEASLPDVIVTDYQMTGCNGATVARMAQKGPKPVPVIVLTAFKQYEMEANLGRLGVKRILDKPISAEELVEAVKEALETPST
jgi:CheY-like chemotaxis protein